MASIPSNPPSRAELAEQYRAQMAEKEELAESHAADINNIKNSYATEKADLEDRYESSIQTEKNAQYDHLRNLKHQLSKEERQLQATRDSVITKKQGDFKHEEINAESDGRARVKAAIDKYAAAEESERNRALKAEEIAHTDHRKSAEHIINDSQKKLDALAEDKSKYLENAKDEHAQALHEIHAHYQDNRILSEKQYGQEAKNLSDRAEAQLDAKRLASQNFLETYEVKSQDPFYQLQRFEASLVDVGDAYSLRVRVPEYERKQFRVQVSGQEIQLQGIRSNDTSVELEPGRKVSTRSYQNVQERFALDEPVDGKQLTFQEDGEYLQYMIPKFGPNHRVSDQFRKPKDMTDAPIARELDFKYTLPTADSIQTRRNKTLG